MKGPLAVILILTAASASAQTADADTSWKKTAVLNVNFTQAQFDNWAPGGEDAWSWQSDLLPKIVHESSSVQWMNTGKFSFGQAKVGDMGSRKSADEIRLESVLTWKVGTWVNPYAAVTGLTQFAPGYAYDGDSKTEVSGFLDPGYFTQSAGLGVQPNPHLRTRFGAALKESVTRNHPAPYADDPKTAKVEKIRAEPGAEWVTDADWKLHDNILFTSKLETFANFKGLNAVDVNWDNVFSSKITKLISVSFNVRVTYDRDVSRKRQIKQVLGVGLSYTIL
ncbi:MAG: DUF3078 domain-containing protein [bacterium]|nr:DUF3078 domain-containing protein [bacterium]